MSNSNFNTAKNNKNDEFYTCLSDVEMEINKYRSELIGKTVFCNCNDGENSSFWLYLSANLSALGLKRLIAVKYEPLGCGYVLEMERVNGKPVFRRKLLHGNGDFRSPESLEYLRQADLVITNPPFSLFREYISLLTGMDKKFLIIGNMNALTFMEVFPFFKENKMWLGYNSVKDFVQPTGDMSTLCFVVWFTNLRDTTAGRNVKLSKRYVRSVYPEFDNYLGINCDRVSDIPIDYPGVIGVPISFIQKYSPNQFEIVGITGQNRHSEATQTIKIYTNAVQHHKDGSCCCGSKINDNASILLNSKPEGRIYYTADNADGYLIAKYARLLIKHKTA